MIKKILLIEDDADFSESLIDMLEVHDFEVTLSKNGKIALEVLETQTFDLIITDIVMPEMEGMEFLRLLIDKIINIPPIIINSGNDVGKIFLEPALKYCELKSKSIIKILEKPYEFSVLLNIIKEIEG